MTDNSEYVKPRPVWVWGVPIAPLTFQQTVDEVEKLIQLGKPSYFITANLNYHMLTDKEPRLAAVNEGAAFITADGAPVLWGARLRGERLPERVTGSDLLFLLCARAASRGYRIFFLGGEPGVAEEAAQKLCERYPGLQIVGTEAPPFRPLSADEEQQLFSRIRDARPDMLFVAFGQPRGELWIAEHCRELGVPVSAQVGASFNFAAGRVRRAPRWLQKMRLEVVHRFYSEPMRLGPRYARNALFLVRMVCRDLFSFMGRKDKEPGVRGQEAEVKKQRSEGEPGA